ncbi:MAG TPA: BACON domain-containing carbohydrate-binding protein, partial [Blastocatellia bacterium]|nr:BACON domain-containing carbohydrate-binding protein [Blastocatellia bacterium]
ASSIPLPTALAGTTVEVTDSAGMTRLAPLFFVSSGQVNYLIPSGVTAGSANVTIRSGAGAVSGGNIRIMAVAPGLFSANSNGQGVAAAVALRARGAMQTFEPIARFDGTKFVSAPIDLGPAGDQIFLLLFGTGIRSRNALSSVTCKIGAVDAPVLFAGAAPGFVGLDQVNIGPLPSVLAGRGELDVALTVDGRTANTVTVAFSGTPTCAYSISPSERSLSAGGGPGSVNVTAPSGCAWTATSNAAWLTISSGAAGNSSGVVNYSVAANTGASQRTGTLTIAGQTFTVTQAAGVQAISVGQLVTGALTNDDLTQMGSGGRSYFYDAHRFSVTSANTTVAIDLRSTQFDAEIILYREENNRLVQVALDDQSGGYGNGVIENNNALLLTTLPTLGDYVIFATSSDVAPNSLGNYTLRLNANALQNLSYGANIANASISTTDIQTSAGVYLDAYWFTGQQGDEVQIRMGSSAFDSFLILQASAGGAPIAFDDNNGGGRDALIRHRLPANGNYIILAMPYAKNLIGAYTLTLSKTN